MKTGRTIHNRSALIQTLTTIAKDVAGAHGVQPDERSLQLLIDMGLISAGQDPEYMQRRK